MKKKIGSFLSYHFDSNNPGPHLLITAGVHGDEYEPMLAAHQLIKNVEAVIGSGKLTVVPVVNQSAFSLSTRCAIDGMDLARTCPGFEHGSISEIVARELSLMIYECDFYIDMHTGGMLFNIYPLAGYMLHDSPEVLQKQQQMAEAFNLPVIWGTDKYAEGRTLSVARDANVPAIYVEYGGGVSPSMKITEAYYNGCLNVMRYLNMTEAAPVQDKKAEYWVEDYRLNNGVLQTKMPSSSTGLFLPAVQPGEQVNMGGLWGIIISPQDGTETEARADTDGLVLFIRISSHVKEGESLGGILPITKPGKLTFNAVV